MRSPCGRQRGAVLIRSKWPATDLVKARVLNVVRGDLFLALNFDADVQSNGTRNGRFVSPLFQVVPNVHFTGQSSNFDYGLAQEVIGFASQFLPQFGLEVVVFIPHSHFYSITRVVALEEELLIPNWIQVLRHGSCSLFNFANLNSNIWITRSSFVFGS